VTEIKYSTPAPEILQAQSENGVSDLLRRAIERHEAAYAYFLSTTYLSDEFILGRQASEDEKVIYDAASNGEASALSDVCYFPARTAEDMAAKARHLRKYHTFKMGNLEAWQVENLLRSMLPDGERDQLDDDAEEQRGELATLVAEYKEVTARINAYEGGADDPAIGDHCDKQSAIALKICGYRPQTDDDVRLKVEFLRNWSKDTRLDKKEQDALFASMLPEGGEA
jgi:hypothetical protein